MRLLPQIWRFRENFISNTAQAQISLISIIFFDQFSNPLGMTLYFDSKVDARVEFEVISDGNFRVISDGKMCSRCFGIFNGPNSLSCLCFISKTLALKKLENSAKITL